MTEGMVYEEDQLVWAKIRGYPWWPGVISKVGKTSQLRSSEDIQYTIKFIGENTHASLSSKYINEFDTYYSQHSKLKGRVPGNKWLLTCIEIAKKLYDGILNVSNLSSINDSLIKKKQRPREVISSCLTEAQPKEPNFKLEQLKRLIEEKIHKINELQIKTKSRKPTNNILARHEKLLSEFTEEISDENDKITEICESLYELIELDINAKLLAKNPIKKIVKLLANLCQKSNCEILKELAEVALRLREYWKKIREQGSLGLEGCEKVFKPVADDSYIADKCLRRRVCCKIAKVLENNKFTIEKAQELALSIEKNLRKKDPSMSSKYRYYFRIMIRDIKNISPVAYEAATEAH